MQSRRGIPGGNASTALDDTGVSQEIAFQGVTILAPSKAGTYCSGFTFAVAMRVAKERGLLKDATAYQVKRFQREWYGATSNSRLKQLVTAMESLEIGHEVHPLEAKPGDFMVFSREKTGHSVIFLDWVNHDGAPTACLNG